MLMTEHLNTVWRSMQEKGVAEKYERLVKHMYKDVTTQVRSRAGLTEKISVQGGMHHRSGLSTDVFDLVMDILANEVKEDVPWGMRFVDVVLVATSKLDVEKKLERWRRALEGRGLKISRTKNEYLPFSCQDHIESIKLNKEEAKCVRLFKCQSSHITSRVEPKNPINMGKLEENIGCLAIHMSTEEGAEAGTRRAQFIRFALVQKCYFGGVEFDLPDTDVYWSIRGEENNVQKGDESPNSVATARESIEKGFALLDLTISYILKYHIHGILERIRVTIFIIFLSLPSVVTQSQFVT
ncbi:uncharacterized protein LOC125034609 [Penaeus chinensis]|uniref:uncharacterized protein LOC125034609 n=1 Tax=Penaeus chinensis TaxID=139456 RepID=UPI001FB7EC8D|nr:uncharacterized protein LOC125034609 [Penaeus chinensis]